MTQQIINIGTADKGNGDPLRTAFTKVNENFTELYAALGLTDNNLNLGAFQFDGNTMSTTDSSNIVIDQAVTINSELTTHGDIVPNIDSEHNLGSPTRQWKSLYVSDNTIYINNVPMTLDAENRMLIDGVPISATLEYDNIPNAPKDISDLTDNTGLLVDLANVDSITFWDSSVQTTAYRYAAQDTAPTITTGALWFNSTDGRLYVNYNNTWVDASPTEIDPSAIRFNEQDQIEFPDGTLQSTAWLDSGSSIVNTTIMSINDFAGGNYDNQGSVSVTYTPYTGAESGFSFNAEFQSPLDATKGVTVGAISTPLIHNNNSINIEINLEDSTKRIWSFEEDGDFKIPGGLTLPGAILSTGHLELDANYDGGNSVYIGNNHPTAGMLGGVVIGDSRGGFVNIITTKLIIGETSVPTHSYGAPGDIAGEVAFDNDYIYYCKQNYVNNSTDIWVRVVWTDTNW